MMKIRQSYDRLIFKREIPIPEKDYHGIEPGPKYCWKTVVSPLKKQQQKHVNADTAVLH